MDDTTYLKTFAKGLERAMDEFLKFQGEPEPEDIQQAVQAAMSDPRIRVTIACACLWYYVKWPQAFSKAAAVLRLRAEALRAKAESSNG